MRSRTCIQNQDQTFTLTIQGVTQVDLVPEGVAQLDSNKLAVPGSLDVLLSVAVGVRVGLEGKLSPDGVFS